MDKGNKEDRRGAMVPQFFKEANVKLTKPDGMTDKECGSLHICRVDDTSISGWSVPL